MTANDPLVDLRDRLTAAVELIDRLLAERSDDVDPFELFAELASRLDHVENELTERLSAVESRLDSLDRWGLRIQYQLARATERPARLFDGGPT